ncbi:MAG: class I SAM-dependent methyltransferase [Hyphomicrobiaceae bacterium]
MPRIPIRDAERPRALAQLRYATDRASYGGLDLAQKFERIHRTNLWGAETSVSGLGSEDAATATLRSELPLLLCKLGAQSLLDAPCGDGGWIGRIDLDVAYTGIDIVPELIAAMQTRAVRGRRYILADLTHDTLPKADVILCRDCLVHFSYETIGRAVASFRASGAQWLITTTFTDLENNHDCEDADWRPLNFERPPFLWGPPQHLLVENCTEDGGLWADKSLGAWRISTLP